MTISYHVKNSLLAIFFMASQACFSQSPDFKKITQLIEKGKNFEALKLLRQIDEKKVSKDKIARKYYYMGKAYSNENINDKSYTYFVKSEKIYKAIDSIPSAMEAKLEIAYGLDVENLSYKTIKKYYTEYLKYTYDSEDPKLISKGNYEMANFLMDQEPVLSQQYYFKALKQNKIVQDEKMYAKIVSGMAMLYNERLKLRDSAIYYYEKALAISRKYNNPDDICFNLMFQSNVYYYKKNHVKAIQLLKEADKVPIVLYVQNTKSRIHQYLSINYRQLHDYEKAYKEIIESQELGNKDNFRKQNELISDLQTQYETKEKDFENLNLKIKNRNSQLLLYLFVGLLVILSFIGFLTIKFLNKKKKIAEQEKLIESQKLENVLKEQELKEIDKLLEGQEKERIKIANDLHDNLGSLMATLKLNFQNLKLRADSNEESNQLFDKTDDLLEEAYQKVRGIAHAKNAGVIANEGLLPAILNIAKKASVAGKLKVEVIPFGLDERLENAIEVTIFRMIQEILTNAIKHSKATEITIHLTQHQDSLNIIVEDNGKGFNPKNIDKNEGMGLPNIEKKVEHMGGTFTIDSSEGKGASILIDIPL